jgi:hypothetical protein
MKFKDAWAHASALLRGAPPFAALRVRNLHVSPAEEYADWTPAALGDVAAAAVAHGCVGLHFFAVRTMGMFDGEALERVCDALAASSRRLSRLNFLLCALGPDAWGPLARVMAAGALSHLSVVGDCVLAATPAQARPFCDALRSDASSSLLSLTLDASAPHDAPAGDGAVDIIAAAAGHGSLRELRLSSCPRLASLGERFGSALAALVRTPGSALSLLDVSHCSLSDNNLAPLLAALAAGDAPADDAAPRCAALATLNLAGSAMSRELEAGPLLAAVAGAASLRRLDVEDMHSAGASAAARRARMLVEQRAPPLGAVLQAARHAARLLADRHAWDTPMDGV